MGDQLPPKGNLREGFEATFKEYGVKDHKVKLVFEAAARTVDLNNLAELQNCPVIVGIFEQQIPMKMGAGGDEEDEQLDSYRQTTSAYAGGKQCPAFLESEPGMQKRCLRKEGHEGLHRNMDGTEWAVLDPNQMALPESDADAMVSQVDEGWYFRIGENDERGPFVDPIAAATAIGVILEDLSHMPEGPYQHGTGELAEGATLFQPGDPLREELEGRIANADPTTLLTTKQMEAQGSFDGPVHAELELGTDVAAQIQAERMSQFEPTDEQKVADVFASIDARPETAAPPEEDEEPTYQRGEDGSTQIKKTKRSRAAA